MAIAVAPETQVGPSPTRISLLPTHPGSCAQFSFKRLLQLERADVVARRLAVLKIRFHQMTDGVGALETIY
jgi:hypothetical protein